MDKNSFITGLLSREAGDLPEKEWQSEQKDTREWMPPDGKESKEGCPEWLRPQEQGPSHSPIMQRLRTPDTRHRDTEAVTTPVCGLQGQMKMPVEAFHEAPV